MTLPDQVNTALSLLQAGGFDAWVVGGAVRDHVMGLPRPGDWDIATSALPKETEAVFSSFRVIETGLKHGTVTVLLDGEPLEITTYRVDGDYTDHRRPDSVRFTSSLEEDLARRDFTMNALAYRPDRGILDFHGGVDDIRRGLVRCVGDPDRRFGEDALRILRSLRFASTYGMTIEENTASAARRNRELLRHVAAERIREELTRLLCGRGAGGILLDFPHILAVPIPELAPMFGFPQHNPHHDRDVWAHTAAVVAASPPDPILRWAALLHDVGKPPCFSLGEDGVGHFYGHGEKSCELAGAILTRLRFDNDSRDAILRLIRYHDLPIAPEKKPVRRLVSRLGAQTVERLIQLHKADTLGQAPCCLYRLAVYDGVAAVLKELLEEESCFSLRDLAVDGRDMMALGLEGRQIGRALSACLAAVIEEALPNERNALLEWTKNKMK